MKPYEKILTDHKLDIGKIAEMFGYKNTEAFKYSSARKRVETGLMRFYNATKK